jgi:HAD superfamily hydrolase (TIGR01509 family)
MTAFAALPFLPDAVIFDMDGLMIDSERVSVACWSQAAQELALPFPEGFWLRMVGLGDRDCERLLLQTVDAAQVAALFARCHDLYEARTQQGLPLRPGILEILQLLHEHGIPRAVATSTRQPRASRKLAAAGLLPFFEVVVTSSDVSHPKPAPDIYLLVCERLGVPPSDALALEDSASGIVAAKAAGLTCIAVPQFAEIDVSAADRVIDSLEDLLAET